MLHALLGVSEVGGWFGGDLLEDADFEQIFGRRVVKRHTLETY